MNYSEMNLPQLKAAAKEKGLKGYSTMKKADLVAALSESEPVVEAPASLVELIKARIREAAEARSNAGRSAGSEATVTAKVQPGVKAAKYRLQRGSSTAKLTARQARRVRKTELASGQRRNVCTGFGGTTLTYS